MLKISVKQSHEVCSKRTMAPVALDVGGEVDLALEAPDREAPDREVDAQASVGQDKVGQDKVDALATVAPVLAGVGRATVEVQQEGVAA